MAIANLRASIEKGIQCPGTCGSFTQGRPEKAVMRRRAILLAATTNLIICAVLRSDDKAIEFASKTLDKLFTKHSRTLVDVYLMYQLPEAMRSDERVLKLVAKTFGDRSKSDPSVVRNEKVKQAGRSSRPVDEKRVH